MIITTKSRLEILISSLEELLKIPFVENAEDYLAVMETRAVLFQCRETNGANVGCLMAAMNEIIMIASFAGYKYDDRIFIAELAIDEMRSAMCHASS